MIIHHTKAQRSHYKLYTRPAFAWSAQRSLFSYSIVTCWLVSSLLAFFIDESISMVSAAVLSIMTLSEILPCWIHASRRISVDEGPLCDPRLLYIFVSPHNFVDEGLFKRSSPSKQSVFVSARTFVDGGIFLVERIGFGSKEHFHSYKYSSFFSSSPKI